MPAVSVVVPCYNQGEYLEEALGSVRAQTFSDFEILVVDDGSTEPSTIRAINQVPADRARVIRTPNRGLAAARNSGIAEATGKYILPLDADDKIGHTYLQKAVAVLDTFPNVGIVYCKAEFFGTRSGAWELPTYQLPDILVRPSIFASSFFRRDDWVRVGGFHTGMGLCWEDYDFWLSLIERGAEVYRIPETLFYYRQHSGNMIGRQTRADYIAMYGKLFERHRDLYERNIEVLFREIVSHWEVPPRRPPRTMLGKALQLGSVWGVRICQKLASVAR